MYLRFGVWSVGWPKRRAAGSGNGSGLRAKLARGGSVRIQKRPGGRKPLGHTKLCCQNYIVILYLHNNVLITRCAGLNSNAVAELCLTKMLEISRHTIAAYNDVRLNDVFNKYKWYGTEVTGKILDLVGFGRIGRRLRELAEPFQMNVFCYDPYVTAEAAAGYGMRKMELDDMIAQADFITIHLPLTPEAQKMFTADRIA